MPPIDTFASATAGRQKPTARFAVRAVTLCATATAVCFISGLSGCALSRRCQNDEQNIAAREQGQLGMQSLLSGKLADADARFSHAIKNCPEDVRLRHDLAMLRREQGRMDDAVVEMQKAVELAGGEPEWLGELAAMQFDENDFKGAWQSANRALERQPSLAAAWHVRGNILKQTGKHDDALRDYHRALAEGSNSDEDKTETLMHIADIYRLQGRPRRALSTLERVPGDSADNQPAELPYAKALAYQALSRHTEAVDQFHQARTVMGDQPQLLTQMAISLWQVGDPTAARNALQVAAQLDPANPQVAQLWAAWQSQPDTQPQIANATQ